VVFKVDSNRSTTLVIVMVSRRAISDAVVAFMVDSPVCLWVLVVSTAAINRRRRRLHPRSRVETQRASIRREAQGLGRESSQRFRTFGPERGPGPGQEWQRSARAAAGSEDPRKIDSTWHTPSGLGSRN
jgi:hypothetical protein